MKTGDMSTFQTASPIKESDPRAEAANESKILSWAALLAGRPELKHGSLDHAKEQLVAWWVHSAEKLAVKMPVFPEAFMTTRFGREIGSVEGHLQGLKHVFHSLRTGAFSLGEAIDHVGRSFAWEEIRLTKWKRSVDNLRAFALWLPAFSHAQEYLNAAFPLGRQDLDRLREALIQSLGEPHQFLEQRARNEFDEKFLEFKKNYMDCYYSLHEDALHITLNTKNDESGVDPAALRNLDLLSGLLYTDKSYLNRVNVLARWIRRNQCSLPLRRILERYPRCFCNFNPCASRQATGMAAQINGVLQEGIEYFRAVLRRCQDLILEELNAQKADESTAWQTQALLGDGAMPPLKTETIEILNRIIRKHPSYFHTRIRN